MQMEGPESLLGRSFGGFRLARVLGHGATGAVYLGQQSAAPFQEAAVKVLVTSWQMSAADRAEFRERFLREVQVLAQLRHPNIVSIVTSGEENGMSYIILPYLAGGTLADRIAHGPLPLDLCGRVIAQIGAALDYAHAAGVIHRDIKPSNILFDAAGQAYLSDFSIVRLQEESRTGQTTTGKVLGTPEYMSPEQARGERVGPAADIYSLGIVLFQMVTGNLPFQGKAFADLILKQITEPPPDPRLARPDLPPAATTAILQALSKDPARRFGRAAAFAAAFSNAVPPAPLGPPPYGAGVPPYGVGLPPYAPSTPPAMPMGSPITPGSRQSAPPPLAASTPVREYVTSASPPTPLYGGAGDGPPRLGSADGQPRLARPPVSPPVAGRNALLIVLSACVILGMAALLIINRPMSVSQSTSPIGAHSTSTADPSTPIGSIGPKGCKNIGVLLPESASSARWENKDRPLLMQQIQKALPGATVDFQNANGDDNTQLSQAQAALTKGECILVVAPHSSSAAATIVSEAHNAHVPVIAYDRLINDTTLDYYVSFDNISVGESQGNYIAAHYQQYVQANGNNNIYIINGSQTDNNALLFKQGVHQVLDPLIAAGTLKLVYEVFTPNWDNPTAQAEMEQALTANNNQVAIAYVANDGMAGTVIQTLTAHGLNRKVLVTGQDATVFGIQQILLGNQTMTVYKSLLKEAQGTAALVVALSNGTSTSSLATGAITYNGTTIPSVLEKVETVDITNLASTVIADGFVTHSDVCNGIPAGTYGSGSGAITCP